MPVRQVIRIDEDRCDGCGQCATACAEGAIAMVDGKARLVSETYCDGLGACLGECPQGAITLEEVDAAAFDEAAVQRHLASTGRGPAASAPQVPAVDPVAEGHGGGCPGSRAMSFGPAAAAPSAGAAAAASAGGGTQPSQLRQWPVQLHLLSPMAPYLRGADLLLAADCTAFALGSFHADHLAGKALAIACPKLDSNQEVYLAKLTAMVEQAKVNTVTVLIMEVPCCSGLLQLARRAVSQSSRKVPIKAIVVGIQGEILQEQWV
jgi:Pyruvate/2-oxoacid:ferredoxin oxidoreductase delta subunit